MICKFCNSNFSCESNLKKHQNNAKYCINIQNNIKNDLLKEIENLKNVLSEKDKIILEKENNILEKDKIILKLETELRIYMNMANDSYDNLKEIAKQPRYQNNNNKYLFMSPLTLTKEEIKQKVEDNFTKYHLLDGQKGVADFAYNNLLIDDKGDSKYICSDTSRYVFNFKNEEGKIKKDLKANNLTNIIADDVITHSRKIAENEIKNVNEIDTYAEYITNILDIKKIKQDNSKFLSRLTVLSSQNKEQILKNIEDDDEIELVIEIDIDEELEKLESLKECSPVLYKKYRKLFLDKKNETI